MSDNTIEKSYLIEIAYKKLKELILLGKIEEEKINQNRLVNSFGISKTPILIALHQLEIDGYLEKIPNKGFYLKKYRKIDLIELQEIRVLFESFGAEKIIENMTDKDKEILIGFKNNFEKYFSNKDLNNYNNTDKEFHEYLIERSKNNMMIKLFKKFYNIFIKFSVINLLISKNEGISVPYDLTLKQHISIINYIIEKDIRKTSELIKEHLESVTKLL